jgi:glycosyltransferase involved in cell wall biosynthesis
MRILLATDTFLPEVNGVTTVLSSMREGLRARGHDVVVVAPSYGAPAADETGVHRFPAIPCPGYGQVRLSWAWGPSLGRILDAAAPDLIHAVTEGPLGLRGRGWARRHRVPLVSSFHTDFPRYAARYLGGWAVAPTRRYLRWFHSAARLTQTPSEITRDELIGFGIAGAMVWGRGVDTALFHPERRSADRRAAMGVNDHRALVLHVGRLAVEKDVDTLITAFRGARERLGDAAAFCVAGDGPRGAEVRAALPFAVHRGFLSRQVLADLYADADLFVFPSPTETCGLVALEAMASGLPVIGADQGGVRENLREGITGLILPAGQPAAFVEGITALVGDASQRHAMREAARAFAVGRDWKCELDTLERVYQAALQARSADAAPSSWPAATSVT